MSANLQAALTYAALGWHVHPCKQDKKPWTKWGSAATTHPPTIRAWWKRWPNALIGIACEKSGMWALDIDNKNGANGSAEFKRLVNGHGGGIMPTVGPIQRTPSGGAHLLFKATPGVDIPNNASRLAPGLDLRYRGYISSGGAYRWVEYHEHITELVEAPEWLLDLIQDLNKPPESDEAVTYRNTPPTDTSDYWLGKALDRTAPGSRDDTAYWLGQQLFWNGVNQVEADPIMRDYARSCPQKPGNNDPYTEDDAIRAKESAYSGPYKGPAVSAAKRAKQ